MKKLLTLLTFTCLGIAIAQEAPAPAAAPAAPPAPPANQQLPPPPAGKPGQPGNRPDHAKMLERQRKRLEEATKDIIAAYDTNKDGKLDEAEKAAMKADFAKVEKTARLARDYRIIERLDTNGDMVLSAEEFEKLPQTFGRDGMRPPMGGPRPPRDGNRPRPPREGGNRPPRKPGEVKNPDAPAPAQN